MAPRNGDDSYALQRLLAVLMTLGPGCAMGFYCAMAGFYIERFRSPAFFIWMVISCVIPGPLVSLLQFNFDEVFDRQFSTSATYLFRVVALQLVLALLAVVWMLMPQVPWAVLGIGLAIGFVCSTIVSSSSQMVGALHPNLNVDSNIGRLLGGASPVAVFFVLDFKPDSPIHIFRLALFTIPIVCFVSSGVLWYVHTTSDVLEKSYKRLAYGLATETIPEGVEDDLDDGEALETTWGRLDTETQPLQPVEDGKVPSWVWIWCACSGIFTMFAVFLMSLCGFFGSARLAQTLSLAKLATDMVGVLFALPLSSLPCFTDGPWHGTLAFCITAYLILFFHLTFHLGGGATGPRPLFLASWLVYNLMNATVTPHIAVTIGAYVIVKDRKRVLLANVGSINVGYFLGSALAASLVLAGAFGA